MIKLPKKDLVREYELTYLAPASLTETEHQKLLEAVTTLIEKSKGSVESSEAWGKKPLAYTIKAHKVEHTEAAFTHLVIKLSSDKVAKLDRDMQLNTKIVRHLLVKAESTKE